MDINIPIHLSAFVTDCSWVLSSSEARELDGLFLTHQDRTGEQVVTVLFPHRQGRELLDIGLEIFNENTIGQKDINNGLLLIIATEEQKIRIITGKWMEITYTEMVCRTIVESYLRPLLWEGKYKELIKTWYDIVSGIIPLSQLTPPVENSFTGSTAFQASVLAPFLLLFAAAYDIDIAILFLLWGFTALLWMYLVWRLYWWKASSAIVITMMILLSCIAAGAFSLSECYFNQRSTCLGSAYHIPASLFPDYRNGSSSSDIYSDSPDYSSWGSSFDGWGGFSNGWGYWD